MIECCQSENPRDLVFTDDVEEGRTGKLKSLHYTQFDYIIRRLKSYRIKEHLGCGPKGKNGGYPTGKDGWLPTLLAVKGRAIDNFIWPWTITVLNAVWWTLATNLAGSPFIEYRKFDLLASVYRVGITSLLAFLLTFRLNRSILRFWEAMHKWGDIVVANRSLVSSILIHGRDYPYERDQVVLWAAAIPIAIKKTLRNFEMTCDDLQDLLTDDEITAMNEADNSPLYAANEIRYYLKKVFDVKKEDGPLSPARSGEMRQHEKYLDIIIANACGLEGLKLISVPIVFVSHLRSIMLIYLISLPYTYMSTWGWFTIPIVAVIAFFYYGVEGAAEEVEEPFEKGRANDLPLDKYCENILRNTRQLVKRHNMRND